MMLLALVALSHTHTHTVDRQSLTNPDPNVNRKKNTDIHDGETSSGPVITHIHNTTSPCALQELSTAAYSPS